MKHTIVAKKEHDLRARRASRQGEVVFKGRKRSHTATQSLCRLTVQGDRVNGMHPWNASPARTTHSEALEMDGI